MKAKKRILIIVASVLGFLIITFCVVSLMLGDKNINGFVGTVGIVRATFTGNLYTELDNDPIKVLIKQNEYEEFLKTYFDKVEMVYYSGHGEKNNIKYKFRMSAFTSKYFIVFIVTE